MSLTSCSWYHRFGRRKTSTSAVRATRTTTATGMLAWCAVRGGRRRSLAAEAPELIDDEVEGQHAGDRQELADHDMQVELRAEHPEHQLVEHQAADADHEELEELGAHRPRRAERPPAVQ